MQNLRAAAIAAHSVTERSGAMFDESAYQPISELIMRQEITRAKADRIIKKFGSAPEHGFQAGRIRHYKPANNRHNVHAGDWLAYFAVLDASEFAKTGDGKTKRAIDSIANNLPNVAAKNTLAHQLSPGMKTTQEAIRSRKQAAGG